MSRKLITGILSALGIILVVISYFQMKAGNNVVAIITGVLGISFAIAYMILSAPEIKKDIEIIKEKKKRK